MSVFACGIIHQGHKQLNDESRARKEINVCLAALLCDHFLPIREWKFQDIDQVLFRGHRFLPVHPAVLKCQAQILHS